MALPLLPHAKLCENVADDLLADSSAVELGYCTEGALNIAGGRVLGEAQIKALDCSLAGLYASIGK